MSELASAPEATAPETGPGLMMRLLVTCSDRPGIVAAVSGCLFAAEANIVRSDQYSTDPSSGRFFLRTEFTINPAARERLPEQLSVIGERFDMAWTLVDVASPKRIAVLVSRYEHCLVDLIYRWQRDELGGDLVMVASNHPDLRATVDAARLPYQHVPVEKGRKSEAEARLLELLRDQCDVVVLARYMQILSGDFLERVGVPVINIHHSFLPAFAGAGPYERARERGVKLIGATAHYVTEDLDEGPIIEQDVIRVDHADDLPALVRQGAEVERAVLARAVQWHCQDRVLRDGNSTIVF